MALMQQKRSIQERGHHHYWSKQTRHLSSADHKAVPTPQEACTHIRCYILGPRRFSTYKTKTPSNGMQHTAFTAELFGTHSLHIGSATAAAEARISGLSKPWADGQVIATATTYTPRTGY